MAKNIGQIVATEAVGTAGAATKTISQAERMKLPNDWEDVVYLRAFVTDTEGVPNPNAAKLVKFAVTGPGVSR